MESIICLILLVITIILFKFIFKINMKEMKKLNENKDKEKITDKFPENIKIAEEMLDMLENKTVKIEEAKNTNTSLYIAVTNKISIADMKNNYARIQTIAHECIHSIQDRKMLLFNFIFSNLQILYFTVILILTIFNKLNNTILQIFILMLLMLIKFAVRSFLEIDAMTRAKFLAEKYMRAKNLCSESEIEELLKEYNKINKVGIPCTIYYLLVNEFIKIIIYIIITMI